MLRDDDVVRYLRDRALASVKHPSLQIGVSALLSAAFVLAAEEVEDNNPHRVGALLIALLLRDHSPTCRAETVARALDNLKSSDGLGSGNN